MTGAGGRGTTGEDGLTLGGNGVSPDDVWRVGMATGTVGPQKGTLLGERECVCVCVWASVCAYMARVGRHNIIIKTRLITGAYSQ